MHPDVEHQHDCPRTTTPALPATAATAPGSPIAHYRAALTAPAVLASIQIGVQSRSPTHAVGNVALSIRAIAEARSPAGRSLRLRPAPASRGGMFQDWGHAGNGAAP